MIPASEVFGILAAACLTPSLYRGAVQDLKEYRFSATHFTSLWVNAAFILVILMYLFLLVEGNWAMIAELVIISILSSLIFGFIGFRYGGGGDWRALIYIAWIAPFMLIYVIFASGICGIVQAVYWTTKSDVNVPALFRKIPFAVSLFCGYVISLLFVIATASG